SAFIGVHRRLIYSSSHPFHKTNPFPSHNLTPSHLKRRPPLCYSVPSPQTNPFRSRQPPENKLTGCETNPFFHRARNAFINICYGDHLLHFPNYCRTLDLKRCRMHIQPDPCHSASPNLNSL